MCENWNCKKKQEHKYAPTNKLYDQSPPPKHRVFAVNPKAYSFSELSRLYRKKLAERIGATTVAPAASFPKHLLSSDKFVSRHSLIARSPLSLILLLLAQRPGCFPTKSFSGSLPKI